MNEDSGFSHMQKHLGVEFLCGGCMDYKDAIPKNMSFHMEVCPPCIQAQKEHGVKESQPQSKNSQNKKEKKQKGKRRNEAQ